MTLAQWLVYHQQEVHLKDNCSWMGIITYKNPLDIWIYQEIIHEVQPDVIVEIGSYAGGSTLFFAHMLDIIGKGIVVTIDIDRIVYEAEHPRIVTITGDSSSESVVGRVAELCEGRTVLVLHDGDHHAEQVIKDLRAYAPFVSVGSYLIVEDGISDQVRRGIGGGAFGDFPGGGPRAATREFLTECDDFIVDTSREHYILTYNPEGFLKRLR
ncbi:MAG: cephalosporin hydroxylase family protein [Actinobacteria bacterium]|nr:cephalosporin hydroxylase family protein [Actinomycetota bacterium]MBU2686874.1 cephalosporin hydroxylase family protein [Actinomycetota bacterium]